MHYNDSICFSPLKAEKLNEKAFAVDKRLFMFIYYDPKPYMETESARSRFITAAVNLYGLIYDCSFFLGGLWRCKESSILVGADWESIKTDYKNARNISSCFRGFFCHNNSNELLLQAENRKNAEEWISSILPLTSEIAIEELSEYDWEILLEELCRIADSWIDKLIVNMDSFGDLPDDEKAEKTENWITEIAKLYLRKTDYFLNAMAEMYRQYQLNLPSCDGGYPTALIIKTKKWVNELCGKEDAVGQSDFTHWLDKEENVTDSKVYKLLENWPEECAKLSPLSECNEAPLPGGEFFKILARDVYLFAQNPDMDYDPDLVYGNTSPTD